MKEFPNFEMSFFLTSYAKRMHNTISFAEYIDDIKRGRWARQVKKVRAISDKDKRQKAKRSIPSVTTSGVFKEERKDDQLSSDFSNIIVLDLDVKGNEGISLEDVVWDANRMPSTIASHLSVSGEGYAIYVAVDRWSENTYKYVQKYYEMMLGVTFDSATCNLSRLRYVSYDTGAYYCRYNILNYETKEPITVPVKKKVKSEYIQSGHQIRETKSNRIINDLIETVIGNGDDPTSDYHDWFRLGCAFAKAYGENGRSLFQKVSSNYDGYDPHEVDATYNKIINLGSWDADKGTIVYILSQYQ